MLRVEEFDALNRAIPKTSSLLSNVCICQLYVCPIPSAATPVPTFNNPPSARNRGRHSTPTLSPSPSPSSSPSSSSSTFSPLLDHALSNPWQQQQHQQRWVSTGVCGALALVVDRIPPASKHIQIFDLHSHTRLFSVQLYESMEYLESNYLFHSFEVEGCMIGLSFPETFEDEAHQFLVHVRKHIPATGSVAAALASTGSSSARSGTTPSRRKPSILSRLFTPSSPANSISSPDPQSFVHLSHITWDSGSDSLRSDPSSRLPESWEEIMLSNPNVANLVKQTREKRRSESGISTMQSGMHATSGVGGQGIYGSPMATAASTPRRSVSATPRATAYRGNNESS